MRDVFAMDKQAKRKQVIPDDVQADLDDIEAEYAEKEELLSDKIKELEAHLKNEALVNREPIRGEYFQVIFTRGGYSVKTDDVLRVADRFEKTLPEVSAELRAIITKKKDSVSIQPRKSA
jgi:hypothetical protein